MSLLEIVGLHKRYAANGGEVVALRDLHLSVEEGEFLVLLGPSGCGKSTLLQIIAGLQPPSAGEVRLAGKPVTRWGAERILIFQKPNLFPWLTALDNVAFGLRMAGLPAAGYQPRAREALERMGLAEAAGRYPHELSGGMQQRVALARALVLRPVILLMDEPLASTDALLRAQLQREVWSSCAGRTVLFVTHSIREALCLAHRIAILSPQPGHVTHLLTLEGQPPREPSGELLDLEREIEQLLASGRPAGARVPAPAGLLPEASLAGPQG